MIGQNQKHQRTPPSIIVEWSERFIPNAIKRYCHLLIYSVRRVDATRITCNYTLPLELTLILWQIFYQNSHVYFNLCLAPLNSWHYACFQYTVKSTPTILKSFRFENVVKTVLVNILNQVAAFHGTAQYRSTKQPLLELDLFPVRQLKTSLSESLLALYITNTALRGV